MSESLKCDPCAPSADVLITRALLSRPERSSSLQAEITICNELLALADDVPDTSFASFVETTRRLCNAGSAGVSMVRTHDDGGAVIRWESISGRLSPYEGRESPRECSPCGTCIDSGETILLWRPERAYRHLGVPLPPIVEYLIVPFRDEAENTPGTLWVTHHDSRSAFCASDARMLERLAVQLARTLRLRHAAANHRSVLASVAKHEEACRELTLELNEERTRRKQAEALGEQLRAGLMFKDAAIHEAHHRIKNSLQIAASLLSIHARATTRSEIKQSLDDARSRLLVLARLHELLYSCDISDREIQMSTLLEAVADTLRKSFDNRSAHIVLTVDSQRLSLPPEQAVPLALFANEIVTNAYKHAFPDGVRGEINLQLGCTAQDELVLRIEDDGRGMLVNDTESTNGMRLVRIFAQQLRGQLTFAAASDGKGTRITLTAPLRPMPVEARNPSTAAAPGAVDSG